MLTPHTFLLSARSYFLRGTNLTGITPLCGFENGASDVNLPKIHQVNSQTCITHQPEALDLFCLGPFYLHCQMFRHSEGDFFIFFKLNPS